MQILMYILLAAAYLGFGRFFICRVSKFLRWQDRSSVWWVVRRLLWFPILLFVEEEIQNIRREQEQRHREF